MKTPSPMPAGADSTFRSRIGPILLLASIFLLNFIGRIIIAPLLPAIEADLSLSHVQAGSLILITTVGYFLTVMGSGLVSSRISHRNTIILSAFAAALALVWVSLSNSFSSLRGSLLLLGLATGFYLPSGIATLTSLVPAKHWGKALAIHELAPNLGFVAAPLVSEALLHWFSWRGVLGFLGVTSALCGWVFWRFGRGGKFQGQVPNLSSCRNLLSQSSFWIMAILFALGMAGSFGIYTMLPLYLTAAQGMDRPFANTLIGLSRVSGLFTTLMAGWATDRFGSRRTLLLVLLLTGLTTLLMGMATGAGLMLLVFVQPMLAVCFFPAGFAAISRIGSAESRSLAVSVAVPLGFLFAGGALPVAIGILGDAGRFAAGIAGTGLVIFCGAFLSRFLRLRQK
ncbi:MAG TPA: MFS transporter [Desulfatiglandales bacterium]|nr:MFS transporter [Desulfatiglandales bacterium]